MKPSDGVLREELGRALAAPAVHLVRQETQRVACPYETASIKCAGYCEITAEHHGEKMQIPGFHEPHQCVVCRRWFKLVPIVTVMGDKIEGE